MDDDPIYWKKEIYAEGENKIEHNDSEGIAAHIAQQDQMRSEAIDALRDAPGFIVACIHQPSEEVMKEVSREVDVDEEDMVVGVKFFGYAVDTGTGGQMVAVLHARLLEKALSFFKANPEFTPLMKQATREALGGD